MIRASELKGANRCVIKRGHDLPLEEKKNQTFEIVALQKRLIKNWFYAKALRKEDAKVEKAFELIKAGTEREDVESDDIYAFDGVKSILRMCGVDLDSDFDERKAKVYVKTACHSIHVERAIQAKFMLMDFETVDTADAKAMYTLQVLLRYLHAEQRDLIVPEMKVLNLFGIETVTLPDLLYIDDKTGDVEAIKIRCRKPDVTVRSKKMDKGVMTSLELYALWVYAKSILKGKKPHTVSASFYFLRKDSDRNGKLSEGFFGEKNVVTLSEITANGTRAELEDVFEPQFIEFAAGSECSGEACDNCSFNSLCNFSAAPLQSPTPKKKKSVSDIALTQEQEDAVFFRKGIARVNAGAGAGKTMVVALRTAYMLDEGVDPEDILLVTFTDAGAKEMRERIAMYDEDLGTNTDMDKLSCMTFNAFGDRIVRDEYELLGFDHEPRLIDGIERKEIITELLGRTSIPGLDYRNFMMDMPFVKGALAVCEEAFHIIKRDRLSVYAADELAQEMEHMSGSIKDDAAYGELLKLYEEYEEELRSRCLIEFQDQEKLLFDLLDIDPYFFDALGYKHIIVDEFQDSSDNQIELVKKLIETSDFESLMIVGDDSQSIFGFREACPENIVDFFDKIGEDGEDIFITQNHRSTPEIIAFANKVNSLNKMRVEKDLIATRPSGKEPVIKGFHSTRAEYDYIADVVEEKMKEGISPEDIAIIAATKSELVKIAGVLSDRGIENILQAPEPMLENSRVQALVSVANAYLDVNATKDLLVMTNCLRGGGILELDDKEILDAVEDGREIIADIRKLFGPKKAEAFEDLCLLVAADDDIACKLVERLSRFPMVEDKVKYIKTFESFGGESVRRDGRYSGVVLSTAHSSKGLEWPVVINTISKYDRNNLSLSSVEERRRLLFVSVTRARDELYVTGQIKLSGNEKDGYAYNRYVEEVHAITKTPLEYDDPEKKEKKAKRIAKAKEELAKAVKTA